ncbi:putative coiled-coil and C2 domain-containing protein 2A, partial [Scophthalmus maximus]
MASSSDIRQKLRKKGRALHETLARHKNEDDVQELQDSGEDLGETLKRRFKDQRQRRKKRLLEQSAAQESHDDVEEISSIQPHSENEGAAEKAADPVVCSRPPTGSRRGLSSTMQHATGSQSLDTSVTQHLEEKLRAAI